MNERFRRFLRSSAARLAALMLVFSFGAPSVAQAYKVPPPHHHKHHHKHHHHKHHHKKKHKKH